MSDEPWPTRRIVVPRSRAIAATRAKSASRSSSRSQRARLLADLGQELGRAGAQTATRVSPPTRTRSISSSSSTTTRSARRPDLDPARVREAEHRGGDRGGGVERLLERDAELVQVAHRLDHRQQAAGEHAVVAAHRHRRGRRRRARRGVNSPSPSARSRDRVGDERDATRSRLPDEAHRVGGEVDAVDDDLDDDVGPGERRADEAGVAVLEGPHRVEEMGDGVDAAVEGRRAPPPRSRRCGRTRRRRRAAAAGRSARRRREARARA